VTRSFRLLAVVVLAVVLAACSLRPALAFYPQEIFVSEVTTNNDSTTEFHFTAFSAPVEFTLTGGSQWESGDSLSIGSHIIRQTVPSGWVLTDISCRYLADDVVSVGGNVFAVGSLGVASYEPTDHASDWIVNLADHSVTITLASFDYVACTFTDDPAPAVGAPVGGFVEPINQLAVVGPYFALAGLIAVATVVAVVLRKRPDS
jgi:hypothetical protein